jgi:hypothetical protein
MTTETIKVISQPFLFHVAELQADRESGGPRGEEYFAFVTLIKMLAESTGLRAEWEGDARRRGYQAAKSEGNPLLSNGLV